MSKYRSHWELNTIPDTEFRSEVGRRNRAKAKPRTVKRPCKGCGVSLTATQRRKPCPNCNVRNDDARVRQERDRLRMKKG